MERIEGLVTEGRALTAAFRASYAFHDGKALKSEYDAWQSRLRLAPGETHGTLTEDDEATIAYIIRGWSRTPTPVS